MFFLDASFLYPRCFKPFLPLLAGSYQTPFPDVSMDRFKEHLYTRNMVSLAKFTRFHNPKSYPKSWEPSINPCPRATSTEPQSTQPPTAELSAGRAPTHHERGKKDHVSFPSLGVPPNHPFIDGFSTRSHPFRGAPIVGSLHVSFPETFSKTTPHQCFRLGEDPHRRAQLE